MKEDPERWMRRPLSLWGRINAAKMNFASRVIDIFRETHALVPVKHFKQLIMVNFL